MDCGVAPLGRVRISPRGRAQELGLSQPELARRTGLSKSYVNYLEAGKYDEIGIGKFVLLVKALDISADDLLGRAGLLEPSNGPTPKGSRILATQFGLDALQTKSALDYLKYLTMPSRPRAKTKT
jgi:transcriptional regulator with XRE-family HTH domain